LFSKLPIEKACYIEAVGHREHRLSVLRSGTIEEKNPFRVVSTKGLGCLEWLYLKLTTSKLGIRFSSDTCV
jgi:hypothetical protein